MHEWISGLKKVDKEKIKAIQKILYRFLGEARCSVNICYSNVQMNQ